MTDNVVYLVDWRVKRDVEARRRGVMSGKVASVGRSAGHWTQAKFFWKRTCSRLRRIASPPQAIGKRPLSMKDEPSIVHVENVGPRTNSAGASGILKSRFDSGFRFRARCRVKIVLHHQGRRRRPGADPRQIPAGPRIRIRGCGPVGASTLIWAVPPRACLPGSPTARCVGL
jgi:hypothetical protein